MLGSTDRKESARARVELSQNLVARLWTNPHTFSHIDPGMSRWLCLPSACTRVNGLCTRDACRCVCWFYDLQVLFPVWFELWILCPKPTHKSTRLQKKHLCFPSARARSKACVQAMPVDVYVDLWFASAISNMVPIIDIRPKANTQTDKLKKKCV